MGEGLGQYTDFCQQLCANVPRYEVNRKEIEIDGTPFTFYDVSAQENNRKKWLHQFKNVEVILFVASLGDFNVISSQDPTRIKLDLALEMFKEVMETEEFKEKPTILLLK